ncbi:Site-specific recombinase XerD [Mucilaginibacter pineti]|uniref:Site-specific recombinase XerD n=1 Tax=Mucilaginibacter pineti TaxID=1391627 RepID=A0A1G7IQP4_9SPHI|nr:site-specific integrase [Mucilaginibacter pineti]SDF14935.1 Site-specific recombinase XerD [Mucilaginibacter pineti]
MGRNTRTKKDIIADVHTAAPIRSKRNAKGEVSIINDNGMIRLRWSYKRERFSYNTGFRFDDEKNQYHAYLKAAAIKLEILDGCFDRTKYKADTVEYCPLNIINAKEVVKSAEITPVAIDTTISFNHALTACNASANEELNLPASDSKFFQYIETLFANYSCKEVIPPGKSAILEKFDQWSTAIRHKDITRDNRYKSLRSKLFTWHYTSVSDLPALLDTENLSFGTYNEYLGLYRKFFEWITDTKLIAYNPFKHVMKRIDPGLPDPIERSALTPDVITAILKAFKNNTFGKYHHRYYDFLYFIYATAARNAEAIGLKRKYVDLENRTITIAECFARSIHGTHHNARVWKKTKTQNIRKLKMSEGLYQVLLPLCQGKAGDDLIFTSVNKNCVDDALLLRTAFRTVLAGLGIDYRVLYTARKSLATEALRQGMNVNSIAYILGHSTLKTAFAFYIEKQEALETLPNIIQMEEVEEIYNY